MAASQPSGDKSPRHRGKFLRDFRTAFGRYHWSARLSVGAKLARDAGTSVPRKTASSSSRASLAPTGKVLPQEACGEYLQIFLATAAKKSPDILRQQLRLFQRGKVTTARHDGPAIHFKAALHPPPRRHRQFLGKQRNPNRRFQPFTVVEQQRPLATFHILAKRRADAVRQPVQRDIGQQPFSIDGGGGYRTKTGSFRPSTPTVPPVNHSGPRSGSLAFSRRCRRSSRAFRPLEVRVTYTLRNLPTLGAT